MNARPRLLWSSFTSIGSRMSNKTKPPTHYETLEINSQATQSEIKTAYFKLSKEYHPDKNSSDAATAKFRDIAEAYEVLGSFQSRKMYDRSILTQTRYQAPQRDRQMDPRVKQYQEQAAVFRDQQKAGTTPVYDFDAWTKAHYGKTLHRTFRDKAQSIYRQEIRKENKTHKDSYIDISRIWAVLFTILLVLLMGWRHTDYDESSLNVRKENVPNDVKTMEKKLERDNSGTESLLPQ